MFIPEHKLKHFDGEVYQADKLKVAMKYLSPGSLVIDCGAHVGTWSKGFLQKASKVISIEPNPVNYSFLEKNSADFGKIDGMGEIELINAVVWNKSGETVKISTSNISICQCVSEEGVDVKTIALDDLNVAPSFIKFDVEGCEYKALMGAQKTIRDNRPIMYVELKDGCLRKYGSSKKEVMALLSEWDFVVVDRIRDDYIYVSGSE